MKQKPDDLDYSTCYYSELELENNTEQEEDIENDETYGVKIGIDYPYSLRKQIKVI